MSSVHDDLRRRVERGQVVVFVGAGVSAAAAPGEPTALWTGLLRHGVARCLEVVPTLTPEWAERVLAEVESHDIDDLLSAAEKITDKLGGRDGGEYRLWLRDTVGSLRLRVPEIIAALAGLGAPVVTTNYDSLIEQGTGLPAVSWQDWNKAHRLVLGEEQGVLHLHGHWDKAESVVLGLRSYDEVLGDERAEALLQVLTLTKSCVFVGFGAGLDDPNFHSLREWLAVVLRQSEHRHFRLLKEDELEAAAREHDPAERIVSLSYGHEYDDLVPFLRSTGRSAAHQPAVATTAPREPSVLPPPPRCVGRDAIISGIVEQLLLDAPKPIPVLGPPGIGKTTICLATVHHASLVDRYGANRSFVRCEKLASAGAMMAATGAALGLPDGPGLRAALMARWRDERALLVLDNIEDPWLADTLAAQAAMSSSNSGLSKNARISSKSMLGAASMSASDVSSAATRALAVDCETGVDEPCSSCSSAIGAISPPAVITRARSSFSSRRARWSHSSTASARSRRRGRRWLRPAWLVRPGGRRAERGLRGPGRRLHGRVARAGPGAGQLERPGPSPSRPSAGMLRCTHRRHPAHTLRRPGGGYGLAAMCVGVGQGIAVVLEAP